MKKLIILLIIALFGFQGFAQNLSSKSSTIPQAFRTLIESERRKCNNIYGYDASYCLYDITGDGVPELWIKAGDCEATTYMKVYKLTNGKANLIYEGDAGHSDQFLYKNQLITVMCQMGAGCVMKYKYNGNRIKHSSVEFDSGKYGYDDYSSKDPATNKIIDYWSSDSYKQNLFTPIN